MDPRKESESEMTEKIIKVKEEPISDDKKNHPSSPLIEGEKYTNHDIQQIKQENKDSDEVEVHTKSYTGTDSAPDVAEDIVKIEEDPLTSATDTQQDCSSSNGIPIFKDELCSESTLENAEESIGRSTRKFRKRQVEDGKNLSHKKPRLCTRVREEPESDSEVSDINCDESEDEYCPSDESDEFLPHKKESHTVSMKTETYKFLVDCVHPTLDTWDVLDQGMDDDCQLAQEASESSNAVLDEEEGLLSALRAIQEEATASPEAALSACSDTIIASTSQANLLLTWPLYDLSKDLSKRGISRFVSVGNGGSNSDHSGPPDLLYYHDTHGLQPTDFKSLRDDVVLSIGVAMLWGWLPPSMTCHCGGIMELRNAPSKCYKHDKLVWYCLNKGNIKQRTHSKKKIYCKVRKSVRFGTWLTKVQAPIANILEAIFYWCSDIPYNTIGKWTSLSRTQIWKVSRACRLVAAKFMLKNPELNRIGGLDIHGKPIVVQVNENHSGKIKYHKEMPRICKWVIGGIEMPAETDPPQNAPKSWAMTVPNRKKGTLIPILKYKIKENSVVWIDDWSSYFTLGKTFSDWDYKNHKRGFKDHITGVNTNRSEGCWKWLKEIIPIGAPRNRVEEYVQLHCFKQWLKNHKDVDYIGYFGILGRANFHVILNEKRDKGDIMDRNPLPESLPSTPTFRGGGRPSKRHRGGKKRYQIQEV